jgi:flagellar protein FlaJ
MAGKFKLSSIKAPTGKSFRFTAMHLLFISLPLLLGFAIVGYLEFRENVDIPRTNFFDIFVIGALLGMLPFMIYLEKKIRWVEAMEHEIPNFLKNLAEENSSGLTLNESMRIAADGSYGPLTVELKHLNAQTSWGIELATGLDNLNKRVPSKTLARAVILIKEAARSGGDTARVLTAAADEAKQIQLTKRTRESQMTIYISIIYIAFLVFLLLIAVINLTLVPQFVATQVEFSSSNEPTGALSSGLSFEPVNLDLIFYGLYSIAAVQSIGNGFICGQLLHGRGTLGFKHMFVMLLMTGIVFKMLEIMA